MARFPGGGDAAAAGTAFGEGWAFLPLGALIVDYALTIAISVAAAASAVIAYQPSLGGVRVPLALVLLAAVAGLTWFGHAGRAVFALMTLSFVGVGSAVLVLGLVAPHGHGSGVLHPAGVHGSAPLAVLLAFPVAMALATGVEAPSSAVAQLGPARPPRQGALRARDAVADARDRRLAHDRPHRRRGAAARRPAAERLDPDRRGGAGCGGRAEPSSRRSS